MQDYYFKILPLLKKQYILLMFDSETGYIEINFLHKPSKFFLFTREELNTSLEYACFQAVTCFGKRILENVDQLPPDKIKISIYMEDDGKTAKHWLKLYSRTCKITIIYLNAKLKANFNRQC